MSSYEDLKHVGFIKLIELKFLGIFSNIYDFFKDNSRCLKDTVVSVETKVISIMEPVNKFLTSVCENTLGFIDEKFDKYAPSFIKSLLGIFSSCVKEKISFIEKVFGPVVQKAKDLIEKGLSTIESLFTKCYNFKKSEFKRLVQITESILEKSLSFTKTILEKTITVIGGIPIIGEATQSIITIQINKIINLIETTTTSIKESGIFGAITSGTQQVVNGAQETTTTIIQKGSETISQAIDTTTSIIGGIPIIGETTTSIIETATSSIKENGISGAIASGTQQVVNGAQETATTIIQKGSESISQALDTTTSIIGNIPIIGETTTSIIETTTSSIKENGIFGAIASGTQEVVKGAQETTTSIIQKGSESVSQAIDTTTSIIGGIPIIGETAQSIISKQTDMASQVIETTTSSIKENGIFGAITSATENVVKQAQETSTSIVQKSTESVSQALDTTKSVVGGIPIIGETAQSIITKHTDMASQLIETTTSSVKENGVFGAISSATQNVVKETSETIIQKTSESATQVLETTKSVVGSIPVVGKTAENIADKATDVVKKSTEKVKKHGLFGALLSAAESVAEDVGKTTETIIKKGAESVDKSIKKTVEKQKSIGKKLFGFF